MATAVRTAAWPTTSRPPTTRLGAFAVAIHGADELAARYEAVHDDYSAIAVKAIADRLAEAFAEWLHQRVRHEWYAPDEHLSTEDLVKENFRGIRPAIGYPACPDHSEKGKLQRVARDRRDRRRVDEELRDDAGGLRVGGSTCTARRRSTSRSAGSAATSWTTTRNAKGNPPQTSNAGSDRAFVAGKSVREVGYPGACGRHSWRRKRLYADHTEARRRARSPQRERQGRLPARDPQHGRPLSAAAAPAKTALGLFWRIVIGTLIIISSLVLAVAGGAYLYFHQSVATVRAHTPSVVPCGEDARHPARAPGGDRARGRVRPPRRRRGEPVRRSPTR